MAAKKISIFDILLSCLTVLLAIYSLLAWKKLTCLSDQLRQIRAERFTYSISDHSYISYGDFEVFPSLLSICSEEIIDDEYIAAFPKSVCMSCVYSLLSEIKDSGKIESFKFILSENQSYLVREISAFGGKKIMEVDTPISEEDRILVIKFQPGSDRILYTYFSETDQDKLISLIKSR